MRRIDDVIEGSGLVEGDDATLGSGEGAQKPEPSLEESKKAVEDLAQDIEDEVPREPAPIEDILTDPADLPTPGEVVEAGMPDSGPHEPELTEKELLDRRFAEIRGLTKSATVQKVTPHGNAIAILDLVHAIDRIVDLLDDGPH